MISGWVILLNGAPIDDAVHELRISAEFEVLCQIDQNPTHASENYEIVQPKEPAKEEIVLKEVAKVKKLPPPPPIVDLNEGWLILFNGTSVNPILYETEKIAEKILLSEVVANMTLESARKAGYNILKATVM